MAIINVALSDTFDQWRTKTNTLGANQGDLANLDAGFAGSDLVSCLNELRSGEDLTQLILGDSSGVGNNRIKLGDSADLQIYHNGTNSIINDSGTGGIRIQAGPQIVFTNAADTETYAKFNDNGSVELRHNNVPKLETTAIGITVSGSVALTDNTSGKTLVANGTSFEAISISGDATLASNGSLTIANDAVNAAKIAAGAVGASEIADGSITSTEFSSPVALHIKNSSGTILRTLRSPGS